MPVIVVAIEGAQKYRALAKRLRGSEGRALRRELNKAIRSAGKPALRDTQRAVTLLPVKGSRGGGRSARSAHAARRATTDRGKLSAHRRAGLRRSVASATGIRIKANGITISVDSSKLPPDQRNLPRALDSRKGWRHPLFGNEERWYAQKGGPWFYKTLYGHATRFRRAIDEALDRIADRIDR